MNGLDKTLGGISSYQIGGMIPLDSTLHFIVGTALTIFLIRRGWALWKIFTLITLVAIAKESYDYFFHLPREVWEFVSDIFWSLCYFFLVMGTRWMKRRLREHERRLAGEE
ncbi:MAG: hypothetical protein A2X86_01405 [Bdellovibrionales bacterium GWA2_49_15]|nr:MAG: hypothetical protein A2X86_01405 [Bdellovibrionales bacterium GWA2_49_15]